MVLIMGAAAVGYAVAAYIQGEWKRRKARVRAYPIYMLERRFGDTN